MTSQAVIMSAPNTDYDAAQALLDLQGTIKPANPDTYVWRSTDNREDMEKTAKLFWNCFIPSNVPTIPKINHLEAIAKTNTSTSYTNNPFENFNNKNPEIIYKDHVPRGYKYCDKKSSRSDENSSPALSQLHRKQKNYTKNVKYNAKVTTREIGTQTEERCFNPNFELMENTIKNLYERIHSLEAQLKVSEIPPKSETMDGSYESHKTEYDNMSNGSYMNQYSEYEDPDSHTSERKKDPVLHVRVMTNHNVYPNSNDLVPIGDGNASVPARLLKHINWNSYTSATRKLLTAVFSRRILATHSLTGKRSPAFPNKPAKKKLDPARVNDIVQTVVERCSVPENVVRTSITTKCADESKMLRTRQTNKKRRTGKKNRENYPPTTSESESDD